MALTNPEQFPEEAGIVYIQGPAGRLELLVGLPEEADQQQEIVALICHPHPVYGGTMRNKVVHMIEKAFRDMGASAVRFNFRGVSESEGTFDNGVGETDDLLSVFEWVRAVKPEAQIWLAGFSFGSYVCMRALPTIQPAQLLTVAPPVERYDYRSLGLPECPWLVIMGDEDDVVSPRAVYEYVDNCDPKPQLITMKAGHFFHRRLLDLKGAIKNGIRRQLPKTESE
ncbi:alpha/beta hydrolase [Marinicella sp. W31]|uniref:alpha/beta hydrolase n=1 Tax=Marinicella sp. W31 TaxID=3023713 RepID=UPI003757F116